MTDPWWYSGPTAPDGETSPDGGSDTTPPSGPDWRSLDWSGLVSGAQRLVDWATERIVVPHAEHDDPAAHPECLVCRAQALMGGVRGRGTSATEGPDAATEDDGIAWIPVREEGP